MQLKLASKFKRVGFISTRIAGTDGVSLEIRKWAEIIEGMGFECYYIAGQSDRPDDRTFEIPEAHFTHPEIQSITQRAFGPGRRTAALTEDIMRLSRYLRKQLSIGIEALDLDFLIVENCLTIPMNIPLGVALLRVVQEKSIPCLAHHHDFYWERERYLVTATPDFVRAAFPPPLVDMQHVVINTLAAEEFSRRTGLSCRVIPNVMDFAHPPAPGDEYARGFRRAIGLADDDLLVLQPTRVVARKGIEHAIELVRQLDHRRAALVITHSSTDEGGDYLERVRRYADMLGVKLVLTQPWIAEERGTAPDGRKLFTIDDAYTQADLVTYPSTYEGFGNAFLEAVYHRKPIVCNKYAIYRTDIEPYGFQIPLFDGFLTDEVVREVHRVLDDRPYRRAMVQHNYRVGRRFFAYDVVEQELVAILRRPRTLMQMLARRRRKKGRG
jgi:glycosyltransferase involved in cell wall biosynthesis